MFWSAYFPLQSFKHLLYSLHVWIKFFVTTRLTYSIYFHVIFRIPGKKTHETFFDRIVFFRCVKPLYLLPKLVLYNETSEYTCCNGLNENHLPNKDNSPVELLVAQDRQWRQSLHSRPYHVIYDSGQDSELRLHIRHQLRLQLRHQPTLEKPTKQGEM